MSPMVGSTPQKNSLTFLSFLQCNRHSNSGDSGISTGGDKSKTAKDNIIVISDDESSNEPEFEMLWEVEFNPMDNIPMPIEEKFLFKAEPESLQESNITVEHHSNDLPPRTVKEEVETTVNLGECEDELLPLCKAEPGDTLFNSNNYILFMCPQCGLNFDGNDTWKAHIETAHDLFNQRTFNFTQRPNNKFQCNKCKAIITRCTIKTLQQHHFTHLPHKVYKCKLCRHEERSLYLMISHIMHHKDKELSSFGTQECTVDVADSVLEHESKKFIAYICPVCGASFDCEDIWQAHINFKHNFLEKTAENRFDDHFKCTECSVEIFSQHVGDLQKHLFTHLPFKSFLKCKICNWTISRKNFMTSHILNLHKTHLNYVTPTSATSAYVAAPNPDSTNEKMSTTAPCLFNYDDDDDMEVITSETVSDTNKVKERVSKPPETTIKTAVERRYRKQGFMCVRCKECFPTAFERNEHNVAEHGKYVCAKCSENFAKKSDLKRHNCERKICYACPQCMKEYNYEKCFNNHVRRCQRTQRIRQRLSCPE